MNCAQSEQLIDAYLDGELSGSLRLELDAHRLRCRRCQLTLATMEAVGHVVAADPVPVLRDDFTDRVLSAIEQRRPLGLRLRSTRVAAVVGALLQAAAVIYLAVVLPPRLTTPASEASPGSGLATWPESELREAVAIAGATAESKADQHERMFNDILNRVESARMNLATEFSQLARYPLAWSLPDDFARTSGASPFRVLLEALTPPQQTDDSAAPTPADGEHSL